jgi:hypothetical protein
VYSYGTGLPRPRERRGVPYGRHLNYGPDARPT